MTAPHTDRLPVRKAGWFDHPVLSVLLGISWLALSHSLEPVHLLSALLIALIVPRLLLAAWAAARARAASRRQRIVLVGLV